MLAKKVVVKTPKVCPSNVRVDTLTELVTSLPSHNRIVIGFPGSCAAVFADGAPLEHARMGQFRAGENSVQPNGRCGRSLLNDAEMQGLAVINGKGLELVVTLDTGAGTALFHDGEIMPHLELAHHPIYKKKTYNDYVGDRVLKKAGKKHWNRRIACMIDILYRLLNSILFIGGGNARKISVWLNALSRSILR